MKPEFFPAILARRGFAAHSRFRSSLDQPGRGSRIGFGRAGLGLPQAATRHISETAKGPFGEVHRRPISQGHRATTRDRCRSGFPRIAKLIDSPTAIVGIVRSISAGPTSGRAPRRPDSGGAPLVAHKIFCRERTCYRARASKMGPVPNVAVPLWPSVFARQCFLSLALTVMTSALGAEMHQSSMMSPLPCRHGLPRWAIRLVSTVKSFDARGEPISMPLSQVLMR